MIYLAPLQGYTEKPFRFAWSSFFTGIDLAISPFIPLSESFVFRAKHLEDVLPEANEGLAVIPQILGNDPRKFVELCKRLHDLGYSEVNWNLGCPKSTVTRKKRGAGILPFPDIIRDILTKSIPQLPVQLSVKTRLGLNSPDEFVELIQVYNDFPLKSLMIHPRTGIQMYEGTMHLDVLDRTLHQILHPVVFSGDITGEASFRLLSSRFPAIQHWMIGRGILVNPFLPEIITRGKDHLTEDNIRRRQYYFHDELFCELKARFKHERTILNKLKDYWSYFSKWFCNDHMIFDQLTHKNTLPAFMTTARAILRNEALSAFGTRTGLPIK